MKVIINEVSIVIGLVQDKYKTNITLKSNAVVKYTI